MVDAIVIGRNEGDRLIACLRSLTGQVRRIIYVDSGSSDGSADRAAALGAKVVALNMEKPFTAARARNAGVAGALADGTPEYLQFVDGDCTVAPDWVATAIGFLDDNPDVAVACGRRRERFPEASVYNALCDREWDTPVGPATACGGDALMRAVAVTAVGGYNAALIAGEEPDLCLRLRRSGWKVWRLDAEMTLHDAAMTRFGQWWRRTRRAGHAFAEGAALHGDGPERHWVRETRRAVVWGLVLPLIAATASLVHPVGAVLWLTYPAQVARLAPRMGWTAAAFTVIGKLPEALGVMGYHLGKIRGRKAKIIEYK
ncbi:MAG: glycosyltransferase [Gemmobacter sp.]|nr:glycosyltransferase [Gemmobacter sp.]